MEQDIGVCDSEWALWLPKYGIADTRKASIEQQICLFASELALWFPKYCISCTKKASLEQHMCMCLCASELALWFPKMRYTRHLEVFIRAAHGFICL